MNVQCVGYIEMEYGYESMMNVVVFVPGIVRQVRYSSPAHVPSCGSALLAFPFRQPAPHLCLLARFERLHISTIPHPSSHDSH